MPPLTCSHCQATFPGSELDDGKCPHCNELVELETQITARDVRDMAYTERPSKRKTRDQADLPERYATWEEMRELSPTLEQELRNLKKGVKIPVNIRVDPVPDDVPAEVDDWDGPLGTTDIPGKEVNLGNKISIVLLAVLFAPITVCPAVWMLFAQPSLRNAGISLVLIAVFTIALVYSYSIYAVPQTTLWVFDSGILLRRSGGLECFRWKDIEDFKVSNETSRPMFWLVPEAGITLILSRHHTSGDIALMEFIEARVSAAQLLPRLKAIWNGKRESFDAVSLSLKGIKVKANLVWSEVRSVDADTKSLLVESSQQSEPIAVRYRLISFPMLLMAITRVMMDEHERMPEA